MEEAAPCLFQPRRHSLACVHITPVSASIYCLLLFVSNFLLPLITIHVIAFRVHLDNPDNFPISRSLTYSYLHANKVTFTYPRD